ncbi:5489_t:CDS:2, partial [Acaulospora colombiana]
AGCDECGFDRNIPKFRFSADHAFEKPNDERALRLMDAAAIHVMKAYPQVALAFGESDEFRRSCDLYGRRTYTHAWATFFPDTPLQYPPSFDGRVVAYPSSTELTSTTSTTRYSGHSYSREGSAIKMHTRHSKLVFSLQLLHRYRKGSVLYRKESVVEDLLIDAAEDHADASPALVAPTAAQSPQTKSRTRRSKKEIVVEHCDIMEPQFWETNGSIL